MKSPFFLILLFLTVILQACVCFSKEHTHQCFTRDDLAYVYLTDTSIYHVSTLTSTYFYNEGTNKNSKLLAFKINTGDTVPANYTTYVLSADGIIRKPCQRHVPISGFSNLEFTQKPCFLKKTESRFTRSDDASSTKTLHIQTEWSTTDIDISTQTFTDSAIINNIVYPEVCKIQFPIHDSTDVKEVFFAKNYGFLKIETANGNKAELLQGLSKE